MRKAANTEAEGGRRLVIVRLPAVTSASNFRAVEKRSEMDVFGGWSWQTVKRVWESKNSKMARVLEMTSQPSVEDWPRQWMDST